MRDRKKRIVLRADGSLVIGYGHLFRLLALAEILGPHFACSFASQEFPDVILQTLERLDISTLVVPPFEYCHPDLKAIQEEIPFDLGPYLNGEEIVVTDGYWFGANYQKCVKDRGSILVCVDDLADMKFMADVILNHAPLPPLLKYKTLPATRLCLGLDYLLLRPVFLEFAGRSKRANELRSKISSVGICLGGSRHPDVMNQIVNGLAEVSDVERVTILGTESSLPNMKKEVVFLNNLNAKEIISFFIQCDLVICTPSTICLEACCIGLPIMTVLMANNQKFIADGLSNLGVIRSLNILELNELSNIVSRLDIGLRKAMVERQGHLFDGQSMDTILELFASLK